MTSRFCKYNRHPYQKQELPSLIKGQIFYKRYEDELIDDLLKEAMSGRFPVIFSSSVISDAISLLRYSLQWVTSCSRIHQNIVHDLYYILMHERYIFNWPINQLHFLFPPPDTAEMRGLWLTGAKIIGFTLNSVSIAFPAVCLMKQR